MPAPWLIPVTDKNEKKMCKTMKKIIKDTIILNKVKQAESIMNDRAFTVSRKLEERFGGSWVVIITKEVPLTTPKEDLPPGSYFERYNRPGVKGTHFVVLYEGEKYKIFQSKL